MANDTPIADIVTYLDTDLKEVMDILSNPKVFEVMLNPTKLQNGQYEGHLWYEAAGMGMKRLTIASKTDLNNYPKPKPGDIVVIKTINDGATLLNYQVLPRDKNFYKAIRLCMCYTLQTNNENEAYLDQEEYYKLNEFATYLQTGYFAYKEKIPDGETINGVIQQINDVYLKRLDISFKLQVVEVSEDTNLFPIPKYSISKEFCNVDYTRAEQIIGVLASASDKKAHKYEPIVEVQIPYYGHRFTGVLPPVSKFPMFCIRKHSSQVKDLEEYVTDGIMPEKAANIIREWIKRRYNFLICGSVGSGKTTLLNTCLKLVAHYTPNDRVGIIEDTPEVQNVIENSYSLACSDGVSFSRLLRTSLRLSANRLVAGEIRGPEAYVLLKALTSGFIGCMGTIHAEGASLALDRYEQCLTESEEVEKINRSQIAGAIHGIISIQKVTLVKDVNGVREAQVKRKVTAIRQIKGYDPRYDLYEDSWLYKDPESFMLTADAAVMNNKDDFAEYADGTETTTI